jgi:manganese oxidase
MSSRWLQAFLFLLLLTLIPVHHAGAQVTKAEKLRLPAAVMYRSNGPAGDPAPPTVSPGTREDAHSASQPEGSSNLERLPEKEGIANSRSETDLSSKASFPSPLAGSYVPPGLTPSSIVVTPATSASSWLTSDVVVSVPAPPPGGWQVPIDIPVSATLSGAVGMVHRVEFYADGVLIGTAISAPYNIVWTNAGVGITVNTTFAVTAQAFSIAGPIYTSNPVSVLIKPPASTGAPAPPAQCKIANIVALDQVFFYNRLGTVNPGGMIYALRRDIVPIDPNKGLTQGNVRLRDGKRARPLALRMNVGDCLRINFQNLLAPDSDNDDTAEGDCENATTPEQKRRCDQPRTRTASAHVQGLQLVSSILSDGSFVGENQSSLVQPGGVATYIYYADKEGANLMYSTAATTGGEGDGGSLANGLFGVVNVEPAGAEYYRSQLTHAEMIEASNNERWPTGQPKINYDKLYSSGEFVGLPIIKMLNGNEIVHADLNAIITGPGRGNFTAGTYPNNPTEPQRNRPFREFSVVYHDEIVAVQAFPQMEDRPGNALAHTLHSVRDGFAINYGTGGIGAEILANRFNVGPMHDCAECNYEEFFLSAWTVGDPAMIVDVPANTRDGNGVLIPGAKATKAFFPEDPSNVHHSYINDHTKFRVVHAGPKEHHIHHLHAHQWLHTPNDDNSTYLDSQAIGPGSTFTMEITYNGSGNRNKVVGDSIFHCHFYPHFAQGMWELWRSHDVFEEGTELNFDGTPTSTSRRLPDGEIAAGTPIPAIVPIPTYAMAPIPTATVPGYPFFIAGEAGHRVSHPPLDTEFDGGLPRHIIEDGVPYFHKEKLPAFDLNKARLDFDKGLVTAVAREIPEGGTPLELAAMAYHAVRNHPSLTPEGASANFILNGAPAQPGAPYADPCVDDNGTPTANRLIVYKAAAFQFDIKLNKVGWHFPQQRILALWEDVEATIGGDRPPEPLFFRANTNDCVVFKHTNLVPRVYQLDDFQVRTPTDVIGQHIHLVKFDVTSSDGSGNGWNYEDGTFSPDEVLERIEAINSGPNGGLIPFAGGQPIHLTAQPHPRFGTLGAQVTVQRWFADDTLNNNGFDRTLRTVFTHDHFGPSTHQQVGLYAGLVAEKQGSVWRDPETNEIFGTRIDGGPTRWRADILTPNPDQSFREFLVEFADFQHAYRAGGGVDGNGEPIPDPEKVINPPAKKEADFQSPFVLLEKMEVCPRTHFAPPCPEAISAADVGTMVTNYRNEPIPHRIWNFDGGIAPEPGPNDFPQQAPGEQGDLANVYRSNITRVDARTNVQPDFYKPLTLGVQPGDPYTPLMRAYEDDPVQIRILVGAHEEGHNFTVNGIKWLFEPGTPEDPATVNNSGYRNSQMMGISEHFEFHVPVLPMPCQNCNERLPKFYDFRYAPGVATDDQWNGMWGILRAYRGSQPATGGGGIEPGGIEVAGVEGTGEKEEIPTLLPLPNNADGRSSVSTAGVPEGSTSGVAVCPAGATTKVWNVSAYLARDLLADATLVYNPRTNVGGRLEDPTAIMYVRDDDVDPSTQKLKPEFKVEPLILRAKAGDCITVNLTNHLPEALDLPGHNTLPMIVDNFNNNQIMPSAKVGLHPQMFFYDVRKSDGMNVGFNPVQTADPGQTVSYVWYAGDVKVDDITQQPVYTPVEFGATNLMPADPIKHSNKGAIGAMIIEAPDFDGANDYVGFDGVRTHAQATLNFSPFRTPLREAVLLFQNDINLRFGGRMQFGNLKAVPNLGDEDDPEDTGQKAINYRTEPMWKRLGYEPDLQFSDTRKFDFTNSLSNIQIGGQPVTQVFAVGRGNLVRFRVLHPGGHARNQGFIIHGHEWQEEPYTANSTRIGNNPLSEWKGSQAGHGPSNHFEVDIFYGAGGRFKVIGDHLYRDRSSFTFDGGIWGIFRIF